MKASGKTKGQPPLLRQPSVVLRGIAVSSGIVIGKAYLLDRGRISGPERQISPEEVPEEIRRFRRAVKTSKEQLQRVRETIPQKELREHAFIIETHLLILEDRMIVEDPITIIRKEKINAEAALQRQIQKLLAIFESIQDPYLKERGSDLDNIGQRILRNLVGAASESIGDVREKVVVVAHDLSPADTAQMDRDKVTGFATDIGGRTSHTAIMARALEIPAVVGLERVTQQVKSGDPIIVDGVAGKVILHPTRDQYADYLRRLERYSRFEQELLKNRNLPALTMDGHRVRLAANIETNRGIPSVLEHGGEGIGLYRTEFLYLNRATPPTEEEHYTVYREVVERTAPFPTTIRTFDLGGDKFLSRPAVGSELNPGLGLRAIRLCLREVELFKLQLRGILRASAHGKVRILLPMVSGLKEVRETKAILDEVKADLVARGQAFDPAVMIGCMIETPATVMIVDLLARECDFFSIGTNDLIQYALAIDRVNEQVAYLYEPLHPAILRMIRHVMKSARQAKISVGMCGEMAGEALYTLILLGLGLDEFSMNPLSIPRVKSIIRSCTLKECEELAKRADACSVAEEVETFLKAEMAGRFPEFFPAD